MSVLVGCNSGTYQDMHHSIPDAVLGRRVYYDAVNGWPPLWPKVEGSPSLLSIRPNPPDLLSGVLDTRIRNFCNSAPPNSDLTSWHEAGNIDTYDYSVITPETMTKVHHYMQGLVKGTPCAYGVIMCMPPDQMSPWMPGGLDWYGLDIYEWAQFMKSDWVINRNAIHERLHWWKAVVQNQTGLKNPRLNICETNAFRNRNRPAWFLTLGNWLHDNGGHRMLTFWSKNTGLWQPHDHDTIDALRYLAKRA